ncbi:hypothetical protein IL306_007123 [Fusarium sp. DS 682]|nr:hypothetical protein IL306_007123 [Fusarium sp. DS 682]
MSSDNLYQRALLRFDSLVSRKKLFYCETTGEKIEHEGFEFRISPALLQKPILPEDAPERQGKGGPFLDPDPDFVIDQSVGDHHVLELSMHCLYRPLFILHTKQFAPQTDDLDIIDIAAARNVMKRMREGSGKAQMMIYNCGVEADIFELYPARARSTQEITDKIANVPNQHFVLRLETEAGDETTYSALSRVVDRAKEALRSNGVKIALNVIMTEEWVCAIPRRHARKGITGANGAGMMGIVWLKDMEERQSWEDLDYTRHLAYLGLPIDD